MTIIKLERGSCDWDMIPRRLVQHPRLSLDSKWIPIWLAAQPPNTTVHAPSLRHALGWTERRFRAATQGLAREGMWKHIRTRQADGTYLHSWTCLLDPPRHPCESAGVDRGHSCNFDGVDAHVVDSGGYRYTDQGGTDKKLPPAGDAGGTTLDRAGGHDELIDLGIRQGLTPAQAHRFASMAARATRQQREVLVRELPLRMPGARTRMGMAMRLAERAAQGLVDDTTAAAREEAANAAKKRAEEEQTTAAARRAEAEANARRAREGPSQAERAARAAFSRFKRQLQA